MVYLCTVLIGILYVFGFNQMKEVLHDVFVIPGIVIKVSFTTPFFNLLANLQFTFMFIDHFFN